MYTRSRGLGQTSGLSTIASTIQQIEGYYPGSIAYQNNNPGNLIYVGQAGATQGTPMAGTPYYFASFDSYADGYAALENQIQIYANQGLTIDQMMAKYAPASGTGNNPTSYANSIANALGVSSDTPVSSAIAGGSTDASGTVDLSSLGTDLSSDFSDLTDSTQAETLDPSVLFGVGVGMLLLYGISQAI